MPQSQLKNALYRGFVGMLRAYGRIAWDFKVQGRNLIPRGPKIYVANHIASVDPYWAMMAVPEFLHVIIGPPFAVRWLQPTFRFFEQINAMPQHRRNVVDQACHYLTLGESVYIAPEGDVQPPFQLGHFYSGLAKIYRKSLAPIVPIAMAVAPERIRRHPRWDIKVDDRTYEARMVWRGKVRVSIGAPRYPQLRSDVDEEEDNRRITADVRGAMELMLAALRPEFQCCEPAPRSAK